MFSEAMAMQAKGSAEAEASGGRCVLAIESSCDDTSVAILGEDGRMLAMETASQIDQHQAFGGVVPEVASRNHTRVLPHLLRRVLRASGCRKEDLGLIAATSGPGLASSLLVGNTTAKALALALDKPFLAINHLEGHLLSPFFEREVQANLALVVSGGHTLLVDVRAVGDYVLLGRTLDDAVGEAFDKVAKMLGLPYPGGPAIESRAADGKGDAFSFPRAMLAGGNFDFSFSGLKTSVLYQWRKLDEKKRVDSLADVCASFQKAVLDVLVHKTVAAAASSNAKCVTLSGGVACNQALRNALAGACDRAGIEFLPVEPDLSTDNAAMIGNVARLRAQSGEAHGLDAPVHPNLVLEGLGTIRGLPPGTATPKPPP